MRFGNELVVANASVLFVHDLVESVAGFLVLLNVGLTACVVSVGSVWPTGALGQSVLGCKRSLPVFGPIADGIASLTVACSHWCVFWVEGQKVMGCSARLVSFGLVLMYLVTVGCVLLLGLTRGKVAIWLLANAMRCLAWCSSVCR